MSHSDAVQQVVESPVQLLTCDHVGCRKSFRWLSRQKKNCTFPVLVDKKKYVKLCTGLKCKTCGHEKNCTFPVLVDKKKYVKLCTGLKCKTCGHEKKHQPNIIRHIKLFCGKVKTPQRYKCDKCWKEFKYRSLLKKHLASHEKLEQQRCGICNTELRRKDLRLVHQRTCFVPTQIVSESSLEIVSSTPDLSPIVPEIGNALPRPQIELYPIVNSTEHPVFILDNQLAPPIIDDDNNSTFPTDYPPNNCLPHASSDTVSSSDEDNQDISFQIEPVHNYVEDTTPIKQIVPQILSPDNEVNVSRINYFKNYKEASRKSLKLESTIQSLNSPVKKRINQKMQEIYLDLNMKIQP